MAAHLPFGTADDVLLCSPCLAPISVYGWRVIGCGVHLIYPSEEIVVKRVELPYESRAGSMASAVHACAKGKVCLEAWARVSVSRGVSGGAHEGYLIGPPCQHQCDA
jgi:hypothetical protein